MGYTKTIEYGDSYEIFEYEYDPIPHQKRSVRDPEKPKPSETMRILKRKENMVRAKGNFRRLVAANLSEEKPLLISLTYAENMTDIALGYQDFRLFIQALRYRFGKDFKYIAVPEFQKRGAVHFHTLFWRLPSEVNKNNEKQSRTIANMWDKGFVDIIETDGDGKLSSYLAKYMAKAFVDRRLRNKKAYVSSRNIDRPIVTKRALLMLFYYTIEENASVEIDNTYDTKRLGKCRHRLFKIKK